MMSEQIATVSTVESTVARSADALSVYACAVLRAVHVGAVGGWQVTLGSIPASITLTRPSLVGAIAGAQGWTHTCVTHTHTLATTVIAEQKTAKQTIGK